MEEIEGGGVQLERSDACNDNAASLTSIALHQPHWRTGYSLRLFVRRFTIFRRGGGCLTKYWANSSNQRQLFGGQGLTQDTLQSAGGLETNLINGGYSPSYLCGAKKKKQVNGVGERKVAAHFQANWIHSHVCQLASQVAIKLDILLFPAARTLRPEKETNAPFHACR